MAIKWIISDVDGCITPEESVRWDMEVLDRIGDWCRRSAGGGHGLPRLTLCTGRPQPYVEALTKLLDITAPVICENGAVIYTLEDNFARYGPGVTEEKRRGLHRLQEYIEGELLAEFPEALLQFGKMAQLSVYSERHEVLELIRPKVAAFAEANGPELTLDTSHYYLNISLKGVTKGRALSAVMEELGVSREECAGIGDTEGDLALREAVGWFGCPANARESIKRVADYISPRPVGDGVLDILKRFE